jgi:hypothetical protein
MDVWSRPTGRGRLLVVAALFEFAESLDGVVGALGTHLGHVFGVKKGRVVVRLAVRVVAAIAPGESQPPAQAI